MVKWRKLTGYCVVVKCHFNYLGIFKELGEGDMEKTSNGAVRRDMSEHGVT